MIIKPIIIANWKLGVPFGEAVSFAKAIDRQVRTLARSMTVVLCPSTVVLSHVAAIAKKVQVGAQDCSWESTGAYTGEDAPSDLVAAGASSVILGHSERRLHVRETTAMIAKKIHAALEANLIPILCVGETAEDRRKGRAEAVVIRELNGALKGVRLVGSQRLFIAYEPVWAIGAAQPARPQDARAMHDVIDRTLKDILPADHVEHRTAILYGGSVDARTIREFVGERPMDGVLMGRASWKVGTFLESLKALE